MRLNIAYIAMALLAPTLPALAQGPTARVIPANPVALEVVHLELFLTNCDDVRRVELIDGGLRVVIRTDDRNPISCDVVSTPRIPLGAFSPGNYRVAVSQTFATGTTAVEGEVAAFVVLPGTASTVAHDDFPREDLSGVWTSPMQPSTGLFLVHQSGALTPSPVGLRVEESLTGFWAVFEPSGAPIWYLLDMERSFSTGRFFEGTVVRYTAVGTGASRVVTPSIVGTATFEPMSTRKRLMVNIGGQELEFDIEPLRWTRAAWPGAAPTDF